MVRGRKETGALGEMLAREHLMADGYAILDANWRCRAGELDIVACKDGTLIFVEVRTRSASSAHVFGTAEESVDAKKRAKLRRLAEIYMLQTGRSGFPVRFDVMAVTLGSSVSQADIRHIQQAI